MWAYCLVNIILNKCINIVNFCPFGFIFMYKSPFLTEIYEFMLARNYSKRTIKTYISWIKDFIYFSDKQHPKTLGTKDVERYLTYLAVQRNVAPSTQSIALNALLWFFCMINFCRCP